MAAKTLSSLNSAAEFRGWHDYTSLSISGTFTGTITLQRRMAGDWQTIKTYTAPIEETIRNVLGTVYRVIMTSYTSGSATVDMK